MLYIITFRIKLAPSVCSHGTTPVRERLIYWGHCGDCLESVKHEASGKIGCDKEDILFSDYAQKYLTQDKYVTGEYNNFVVYVFDTKEKFDKFIKHHKSEWMIRNFDDYFGFIDDNRSEY